MVTFTCPYAVRQNERLMPGRRRLSKSGKYYTPLINTPVWREALKVARSQCARNAEDTNWKKDGDKFVVIGVQDDRHDVDALVKFLLDAGNGSFYEDDKKVIDLMVRKSGDGFPKMYCFDSRRAMMLFISGGR